MANTIALTVLDYKKNPIKWVGVLLNHKKHNHLISITNEMGQIFFLIKPGRHNLMVRSACYEPYSEIIYLNPDQHYKKTIILNKVNTLFN